MKNILRTTFFLMLTFLSAVAFGKTETATLAGGCFWCMFPPFAKAPGITKVIVGYTGGSQTDATYEKVSTGTTGHVEAVEIVFDPAKLSFKEILTKYWRTMDPTDSSGQFGDRGAQYRSIIFYHSPLQKKIAEDSKNELEASKKFDRKIVTQILPAKPFFPAEEYHQRYSEKNADSYERYHRGSGREDFLKKHWGDQK